MLRLVYVAARDITSPPFVGRSLDAHSSAEIILLSSCFGRPRLIPRRNQLITVTSSVEGFFKFSTLSAGLGTRLVACTSDAYARDRATHNKVAKMRIIMARSAAMISPNHETMPYIFDRLLPSLPVWKDTKD